jgi:hypothetical protein
MTGGQFPEELVPGGDGSSYGIAMSNRMTVEEWAALPEHRAGELLDGHPVTPAPRDFVDTVIAVALAAS